MTTTQYNLRPINNRARRILPTPKPPGAMPTTPDDSPLTALDDTPEIATFEVTKSETSVLRTVRSYSDVVRASSPWFGSRTPKETTTEQVSVADVTPPTPRVVGPDSESDESDDDGRPWITVQRRHSREGTRQREDKSNSLTQEQQDLVREAERRLKVRTESPVLDLAGPSKGKTTDPREWGAAGLDEEELDTDAQRAALESWRAVKAAVETDDSDPGETSIVQERALEAVQAREMPPQLHVLNQ